MEFSGSICVCVRLWEETLLINYCFFGGDKNRVLGTLVVKLDQYAAVRMICFIHPSECKETV